MLSMVKLRAKGSVCSEILGPIERLSNVASRIELIFIILRNIPNVSVRLSMKYWNY